MAFYNTQQLIKNPWKKTVVFFFKQKEPAFFANKIFAMIFLAYILSMLRLKKYNILEENFTVICIECKVRGDTICGFVSAGTETTLVVGSDVKSINF